MTDQTATARLDAATEPFRRSDVLFREFQSLWASYSEALGMNSFTMSPEDRQANEQAVAEAYQALSKLAQGV